MSGYVHHHRRRWRSLAIRLAIVGALAVATTALAAGLQVRAIHVTGVSRFPVAQVESALRFALGTPTVAIRAEDLRDAVRAVSWVAAARVSISIDGVINCAVSERQPVAMAVDGTARSMLDAEGTVLGPERGATPALELRGFGADPVGRAAVLSMTAEAESRWGARLVSAQRLGPRDVLLAFADAPCGVVADPLRPENLALAHRVLASWSAQVGAAPLRIDVRVPERLAVTPAPPAPPAEGTAS